MMNVDNHLQVVAQAPANHFLDTCQPGLVNAHSSSIGNVALPANGNTDGIEACLLDSLDGLLRDDGIAPRRLSLDAVLRHTYLHRLTILSGCRALKLVT